MFIACVSQFNVVGCFAGDESGALQALSNGRDGADDTLDSSTNAIAFFFLLNSLLQTLATKPVTTNKNIYSFEPFL